MTWVAAGVAVVGGGIQVAQGIGQQRSGRELRDSLNKPEFQIPPEIAKNMSEAEMRAYQGLPDEQKAAFLDNQQRAAQTALRSSSDRRGGLGMISQIQAQQDRSSLQLLQQDVAARDKNILRAQEARNVMAAYREKRFQHDYSEYSADLDYARAQIGAGMQNVAGGLVTAGSAIQTGIAHQDAAGITKKERDLHNQQTKNNEITNSGLPENQENPLADLNNRESLSHQSYKGKYQSEMVDFALADEGSRKQKTIARKMLKKAAAGDMDAYNWSVDNLPEFRNESFKDEGGSINWTDVFAQYGGSRFVSKGSDMGSIWLGE
tara:strand:- start:18081 stop:19040 length:960 start_codon:yes stop_codon:yes gene_type:complete